MAHLAGTPLPQRQEFTRLVCFLCRRPSVVSHKSELGGSTSTSPSVPNWRRGFKCKSKNRPRHARHAIRRLPAKLGRSVTHKRGLHVSRISKLRVSDPRYGEALRSALPPLRHGRRIWRVPRSPKTRAYTASLLSVS